MRSRFSLGKEKAEACSFGFCLHRMRRLLLFADDLASKAFGIEDVQDHVLTQVLSDARALQLTQGMIGCTADDHFTTTTLQSTIVGVDDVHSGVVDVQQTVAVKDHHSRRRTAR